MLGLLDALGSIDPKDIEGVVTIARSLDGRLVAIEAALARIEATLAGAYQVRALGPPSPIRSANASDR